MRNLVFIAFALSVLSSCNGCFGGKGREKPDVSAIDLQVKVQRFDDDFMSYHGDYPVFREKMIAKYGSFYSFYLRQFIYGPIEDSSNVEELAVQSFVANGYTGRLQDSIDFYYHDMRKTEEELTAAFRYIKYYFPEISIPRVVSINSGFQLGAFTYGEDMLGLGLDMYLGQSNPDYDSAGVYSYLKHKLDPIYIQRNASEVIYNAYFGSTEFNGSVPLIEAMVEKGKAVYFLSYVLPDAGDSLLVGFTGEQIAWCEANEYDIWKFMNDKDLLYQKDYFNQKRYLEDGPTTQGMPPGAPGAIGNWIGLQIVRQFMQHADGKISLHDLITKYDSKTIWEKSHYRPEK